VAKANIIAWGANGGRIQEWKGVDLESHEPGHARFKVFDRTARRDVIVNITSPYLLVEELP